MFVITRSIDCSVVETTRLRRRATEWIEHSPLSTNPLSTDPFIHGFQAGRFPTPARKPIPIRVGLVERLKSFPVPEAKWVRFIGLPLTSRLTAGTSHRSRFPPVVRDTGLKVAKPSLTQLYRPVYNLRVWEDPGKRISERKLRACARKGMNDGAGLVSQVYRALGGTRVLPMEGRAVCPWVYRL